MSIYIMTDEAHDGKTSHVNWEEVAPADEIGALGAKLEPVNKLTDKEDHDSEAHAKSDYYSTCRLLAGLAVVVLVASYIRTRR